MVKIKKLEILKNKFYWKDGKPSLEFYGIFNYGLTGEEIEDYLKVRANSLNIKKILKKFWEYGRGSTCALVTLNGKSYTLTYRHDTEHWADCVFNKSTFVMD